MREHLDDIAREHAECAEFFAGEAACLLVEQCAEHGGFGGVESLREQCRDDSGQNVAGAALGEPRVMSWDYEYAPVGNGDEGRRALQEDYFFRVVGDVAQ